MYNTVQLL